jgi:3-keto-5-aminohexanoate cleavage enzyme
MSKPFIVMCAPNGARKTKADHPALPTTPEELADCAESIMDAGASIIHLHVRDDRDRHSLDVDRYRDATRAIRQRVGDRLVIQVTTEACGIYSPAQQMQMVRQLRPEAVSLGLRELCPDETAEADAGKFFSWLNAEQIMTQYILYTPEEVSRFGELRGKGVIPDRKPFVLFVLGRYSDDLIGDPRDLELFSAVAGGDMEWAVCCFGKSEQTAASLASAMSGHARVGFENNLLAPDGGTVTDNSALVRLAAICNGERPLASADDVRAMFA